MVVPPDSNQDTADPGAKRIRVGRLVIGVTTLVLTVLYYYEALSYPLGDLARPGPQLFPTLVAAGLGGTGVIITINAVLGRHLHEGIRRDTEANTRLLLMIAVLVGLVIALHFFSFTASAMVAVYALLHILKSQLRWWGKLLYTIIVVAGTEVLFTWLFDVRFPGGWFGFLR